MLEGKAVYSHKMLLHIVIMAPIGGAFSS